MKTAKLCSVLFFIFSVTACSNAGISIAGLLGLEANEVREPGFVSDSESAVLTGGGIQMKARVTALSSTELTGGGITIRTGVVK